METADRVLAIAAGELGTADYYTRENVDGGGMLLLIYQSLRALLKPRLPNELVRRSCV